MAPLSKCLPNLKGIINICLWDIPELLSPPPSLKGKWQQKDFECFSLHCIIRFMWDAGTSLVITLSVRNVSVSPWQLNINCRNYLTFVSCFSLAQEEAREEAREADSGVVTDAGPGLSTNNSPALDCRLSVLSTVSPSISLDNLDLGEEAATSSDSNRTIEAFTITEYDGSPRRYGSRKSGSKSSQQKSHQNPKIIRGFVYKYHTYIIFYTTYFFCIFLFPSHQSWERFHSNISNSSSVQRAS